MKKAPSFQLPTRKFSNMMVSESFQMQEQVIKMLEEVKLVQQDHAGNNVILEKREYLSYF